MESLCGVPRDTQKEAGPGGVCGPSGVVVMVSVLIYVEHSLSHYNQYFSEAGAAYIVIGVSPALLSLSSTEKGLAKHLLCPWPG